MEHKSDLIRQFILAIKSMRSFNNVDFNSFIVYIIKFDDKASELFEIVHQFIWRNQESVFLQSVSNLVEFQSINPLEGLVLLLKIPVIQQKCILSCISCIQQGYISGRMSVYCISEIRLSILSVMTATKHDDNEDNEIDDDIVSYVNQCLFPFTKTESYFNSNDDMSTSITCLDLIPACIVALDMNTNTSISDNKNIQYDHDNRKFEVIVLLLDAVSWNSSSILPLGNIVCELHNYLNESQVLQFKDILMSTAETIEHDIIVIAGIMRLCIRLIEQSGNVIWNDLFRKIYKSISNQLSHNIEILLEEILQQSPYVCLYLIKWFYQLSSNEQAGLFIDISDIKLYLLLVRITDNDISFTDGITLPNIYIDNDMNESKDQISVTKLLLNLISMHFHVNYSSNELTIETYYSFIDKFLGFNDQIDEWLISIRTRQLLSYLFYTVTYPSVILVNNKMFSISTIKSIVGYIYKSFAVCRNNILLSLCKCILIVSNKIQLFNDSSNPIIRKQQLNKININNILIELIDLLRLLCYNYLDVVLLDTSTISEYLYSFSNLNIRSIDQVVFYDIIPYIYCNNLDRHVVSSNKSILIDKVLTTVKKYLLNNNQNRRIFSINVLISLISSDHISNRSQNSLLDIFKTLQYVLTFPLSYKQVLYKYFIEIMFNKIIISNGQIESYISDLISNFNKPFHSLLGQLFNTTSTGLVYDIRLHILHYKIIEGFQLSLVDDSRRLFVLVWSFYIYSNPSESLTDLLYFCNFVLDNKSTAEALECGSKTSTQLNFLLGILKYIESGCIVSSLKGLKIDSNTIICASIASSYHIINGLIDILELSFNNIHKLSDSEQVKKICKVMLLFYGIIDILYDLYSQICNDKDISTYDSFDRKISLYYQTANNLNNYNSDEINLKIDTDHHLNMIIIKTDFLINVYDYISGNIDNNTFSIDLPISLYIGSLSYSINCVKKHLNIITREVIVSLESSVEKYIKVIKKLYDALIQIYNKIACVDTEDYICNLVVQSATTTAYPNSFFHRFLRDTLKNVDNSIVQINRFDIVYDSNKSVRKSKINRQIYDSMRHSLFQLRSELLETLSKLFLKNSGLDIFNVAKDHELMIDELVKSVNRGLSLRNFNAYIELLQALSNHEDRHSTSLKVVDLKKSRTGKLLDSLKYFKSNYQNTVSHLFLYVLQYNNKVDSLKICFKYIKWIIEHRLSNHVENIDSDEESDIDKCRIFNNSKEILHDNNYVDITIDTSFSKIQGYRVVLPKRTLNDSNNEVMEVFISEKSSEILSDLIQEGCYNCILQESLLFIRNSILEPITVNKCIYSADESIVLFDIMILLVNHITSNEWDLKSKSYLLVITTVNKYINVISRELLELNKVLEILTTTKKSIGLSRSEIVSNVNINKVNYPEFILQYNSQMNDLLELLLVKLHHLSNTIHSSNKHIDYYIRRYNEFTMKASRLYNNILSGKILQSTLADNNIDTSIVEWTEIIRKCGVVLKVINERIIVNMNRSMIVEDKESDNYMHDDIDDNMTYRLSKRKRKQKLRSRNSIIDDWLDDEDGYDNYADLEDFLVT